MGEYTTCKAVVLTPQWGRVLTQHWPSGGGVEGDGIYPQLPSKHIHCLPICNPQTLGG